MDASIPGLPETLICCATCKKTLKARKCLAGLHLVCLKCLRAHPYLRAEGLQLPVSRVQGDDADTLRGTETGRMGKTLYVEFAYRSCNVRCEIEERSLKVRSAPRQQEAVHSSHSSWHCGAQLVVRRCVAHAPAVTAEWRSRGHAIIDLSTIMSQPVAAIIIDENCPEYEEQFLVFVCMGSQAAVLFWRAPFYITDDAKRF